MKRVHHPIAPIETPEGHYILHGLGTVTVLQFIMAFFCIRTCCVTMPYSFLSMGLAVGTRISWRACVSSDPCGFSSMGILCTRNVKWN